MTISIKQSDYRFPGGIAPRRDFALHVSGWKQEVYNCFKNCDGLVTATHAELDHMYRTPNHLVHMELLPAVLTAYTDVNGNDAENYVVTPDPAISALVDGMCFCIQFDAARAITNTFLAVNVSGLGLKNLAIGSADFGEVPVFEPSAGTICTMQWDADADIFQVLQV